MTVKRLMAATSLLVLATPALAAPDQGAREARWWGHVEVLASDAMEGRLTGSPGYDNAAAYVVQQFRTIGLQPAGSNGWFQPVELIEQRFDTAKSGASLTLSGAATPLSVPGQIYFRGSFPMPATVDAPMVFAGYGLSVPDAGFDDLAGLDVAGKVVVVIAAAGPPGIPGALKSDARSNLAHMLAERGAVGVLSVTPPKFLEIPWARQVDISAQPSMYFSDASLRDVATPFMAASFNPAEAERLFAGSGHNFAEIAALAESGATLPKFALPSRLGATITVASAPVHGKNVIARLPGRDKALAGENVVLSAHLDALGVGVPINGDTIYNGAFDNAIGVASVIEIAAAMKAAPPRRSIVFAIVTGEEKGLLGSRYFAARPTVPAKSIVADLNFDMPLPIFPLTGVTPIGFDQSTLGDNARMVGKAMGLPVVPDPLPDRNAFIRSDQYSFIRKGIPALFMKYGFATGTAEEVTEKAWRANRYHAPSDDLAQPVMKGEAIKLNDYVAALLRNVADDPKRPAWLKDSPFRRFAE
jgi:Zn-dependent M28 family amino/carboxypeptidase